MSLVFSPDRLLPELAHRQSSGIDVTLFWDQPHERVLVCVIDCLLADCFVVAAPYADALEAFNHPFGFAKREGALISPGRRFNDAAQPRRSS